MNKVIKTILIQPKLIDYFKKVNNLSLLGQLNSWEFIIIFLTIISPILLYIENWFRFYLIIISIFISAMLSIIDKRKNGEIKKIYFSYWLFTAANIVQLLAFIVFLVILIFRDNLTFIKLITTVLVSLIIIFYIIFIVGILFYILNYVFFMIMKLIFPQHSPVVGRKEWKSLKDISGNMTVNDQIAYLIITILHLLIYFSVVFYLMISFLTIENNIKNVEYFVGFVQWAEKNQVVSIGNTLGIASIVLTLISITYPTQMRIYSKGIETKEN
ncbi:hypothetical protein [Viridibacillus arvi]|uniref:hypothetical protein n=1 Tax=Viridibacillus arvi TaxID=263475 RepID=UPI0036EEF40C